MASSEQARKIDEEAVVVPVAVSVDRDSGLRARQKKRRAIGGATSAAAKICDDPYAVREDADGWPEGPITILFHHEKSKAPWAHNPAIRVPGLEAATPASARTLVCVEESRIEMGHYDSGEPGYVPSWSTILVRLSDHKVYFMGRSLGWRDAARVEIQKGRGSRQSRQQKFWCAGCACCWSRKLRALRRGSS